MNQIKFKIPKYDKYTNYFLSALLFVIDYLSIVLAEQSALELVKRKIRVNTVAFGMVSTDMFQEFLDNGGDNKVLERQYLGVVDVESAANAVMFLLCDSAKFITGSVIPVYGGY